MSACTPPDHAAFESGASRGVTPPLLPTLMMAVILGAASYFCHEPAAVQAPAPVLATAVASAPVATAEAPFIPAPLAFQTQFPMIVLAQAEPAPAAQAHKAARPARIAAARRVESPRAVTRTLDKGPDRAPSTPDKPLPFAAEDAPGTVAASDEGVLPDIAPPEIALPFAPTIRAVTQAGVAASQVGAAAGAYMDAKAAALGAKSAALGAETVSLGAAVSGWVERLR